MTNSSRNRPPNFLIIMSDEHGGEFSSTYGHSLVSTPTMDRLSEEGVTFDAAYCNAPLCVPSRISFMTGQYNSHCEGWDNAVPMRNDAMTWPYLLRSRGYDVVLSGKMHLVGSDHLHGFNRQLARDLHAELPHPIYLWEKGIPKSTEPWAGVYETGQGLQGMESQGDTMPEEYKERRTIPTGAGRTIEIELDDMAEAAAIEYLKDPARKDQPFALCVGIIAPHFPFVVPEPYFSQYYPEKADLPNIPEGHLDNLPASAQRLRTAFGFWGHTEEQVKRARAAYYGLISYVDDKINRLLVALESNGLSENTVVVYTSDHGDMLGEHGIWRKMCFFEEAARIPFQIRWPGVLKGGQRHDECVSLIDLTATILELGGVSTDEQKTQWDVDGDSLMPLLEGKSESWKDEAFAEHNAHGTDRPLVMLRSGQWKLCYSYGDSEEFELYDLESDPDEFNNLADDPRHSERKTSLFKAITDRWDGERIDRKVKASQRERYLIRSIDTSTRFF
jgi:choline-sulfatase